jgi:hypothetical protein
MKPAVISEMQRRLSVGLQPISRDRRGYRKMPAIAEQIANLQRELNNRVQPVGKMPGILQLYAPFYHEDGDRDDIYLEDGPLGRVDKQLT